MRGVRADEDPASTVEGMAARDSGLPQTDAQFDFGRARRRRALARISARLRLEPSDVNVILPFEEVVAALGRRGERRLGLETISLDSIVGTVDRGPRIRPPLPPHLGPRASALGAHRDRPAQGRGHAADRRLPDRRAALRQGRPPPRLGGAGDGARGDRGLGHRGHHRARRRPRDPARGPAAQEPRAPLLRARAAAGGGAPGDQAVRRVALRGAGGGRGGLGFPRHAGAAASC